LSINYRQAAGGARTRFSWVVAAGHPLHPIPFIEYGIHFLGILLSSLSYGSIEFIAVCFSIF